MTLASPQPAVSRSHLPPGLGAITDERVDQEGVHLVPVPEGENARDGRAPNTSYRVAKRTDEPRQRVREPKMGVGHNRDSVDLLNFAHCSRSSARCEGSLVLPASRGECHHYTLASAARLEKSVEKIMNSLFCTLDARNPNPSRQKRIIPKRKKLD